MAEKNYVGNGWKKSFDNGGSVISLQLNIEKLKLLPVDSYGNIKVTVGELKQLGKGKQTHCVFEDTYQKGQQAQPQQTTSNINNGMPDIDVDEINVEMPFWDAYQNIIT